MHPIMAELHQDHINLSRLLGLLDRQLQLFQADEPPDYFLLLDLVEYMESYPDLIHHPREDMIFRVYLEQNQRGEEAIHQLMDEHKSLLAHSHELRNLLEQTSQGSVSPRAAVEESLAHYLAVQRNHLNTEEGKVFALLNDALMPEEWARVQSEITISSDPLFGGEVQKRYQAIFDLIMAVS